MGDPIKTYSLTTNREDLSDLISNISPVDTPLYTRLQTAKATNTYHETQKDTLADAAANINVEGAAFVSGNVGVPSRVGSYTQIIKKEFEVSESQRAVNPAGVKDMYAYQQTKAMKIVARDTEYAFFNSVGAAGDASTGRQLKGVPTWISTNSTDNSGATALTESGFTDMLQTIWAAGGDPGLVMVHGTLKRTISSFTGYAQPQIPAGQKKRVATVSIYESDFGSVEIVLERYANTDDVFYLDETLWEIAWLRKYKHVPIAKVGDSTRGMIIGELALQCLNEAGNGKTINCNIS